jgi:hypothetical protein
LIVAANNNGTTIIPPGILSKVALIFISFSPLRLFKKVTQVI